MENDFSPPVRLLYFGDSERGAFNLYGEGLSTAQKKYKYVALDADVWEKIIASVEAFTALPADERFTGSEWVVNAASKVEIKTPTERFYADSGISAPNKVLQKFIYAMLEFCPVPIDETGVG
ncbi:MAG TPA: hypothetical protein VIL74_16810 [Pyrinomonadaceae bacterium]